MARNGDVMRSDRLKQVMQEIDPNFDEKNLGMSKFSRSCRRPRSKGLLTRHQARERPARSRAAERAAQGRAQAGRSGRCRVAAPREDEEGRGRRGRRGGRGRGRERGAETRRRGRCRS